MIGYFLVSLGSRSHVLGHGEGQISVKSLLSKYILISFTSIVILMCGVVSSCIISSSKTCFHLYLGKGPMFGIKASTV